MTFNFVKENFHIGQVSPDLSPQFIFYKSGFNLGGSAGVDWREVTLSGVGALTLTNALANSLLSLNLFGGTEQRNLPEGYTQVEYIESDGNQWINTGIVPANKKIGAVVDFQCTDTTSDTVGVFGSNSLDNVNNIQFTVFQSMWRYKINDFGAYGSVYDTNRHTISLNMADGTKFDGNVVTSTQYTIDSSNTQNCFLGACNYSGTPFFSDTIKYTLVGKIYSAKVYDNTILIRNYIPCRRNSDSVLGMYDLVSRTFFTNAGSGSFTAGSAVTAPTPDRPIDIVCNNGVLKVKNLFDKSIFANHTGASVTYLHYAVPNGIYTMSSPDFPFTANLANVFFLAGNVNSGASSATNGVAINKPVTITVTNGYYTVVHRYQSGEGSGNNPNHPIDYNWQIEQGNQATTYVPYGQIYVDGTNETVEIHSKNLFDKDNALLNTTITENGVFESNNNYNCSNYIPVQYGKTYIRSNNGTPFGTRYHLYDSNKDWLGYTDATSTGLIVVNNPLAKYTAFAINVSFDLSTIQVELGSTATEYESYYNGGTATAEDLFKVGTYQDVQSVIDGGVTRNVGIKVFDGTENFGLASGYFLLEGFSFPIPNNGGYCTHFDTVSSSTALGSLDDVMRFGYTGNTSTLFVKSTSYPNGTLFKQFLATQYAQGTPVIIVYPLATPTTESVTPQSLTTQAGTNIVEITESSIDGLPLEVSYKATV